MKLFSLRPALFVTILMVLACGVCRHASAFVLAVGDLREGGAVYANSVTMDITRVRLSYNYSPLRGGAIWATDTDIKITDANISHNSAGSATAVSLGSQSVFTYSTESYSVAGGAIYLRNKTRKIKIELSDSMIADNLVRSSRTEASYAWGGALHVMGYSSTYNAEIALNDGAKFYRNEVNSYYAYGGAIYTKGTTVMNFVAGVTLANNRCENTYHSYGGAVYTEGNFNFMTGSDVLFYKNSVYIDNPAEPNRYDMPSAAAMYTKGIGISFSGSKVTFEENEHGNRIAQLGSGASASTGYGGALYVAGTYNFEGGKLSFIRNKNANIRLWGGGGGIAVTGTMNFNGGRAEFIGNESVDEGGALKIGNNGVVNFNEGCDVLFEGNKAQGAGGAIQLINGYLYFNGGSTIFRNNEAISSTNSTYGTGGAIEASRGPIFNDGHHIFEGNKSGLGGGGIYSGWIVEFNGGVVEFTNNKSNKVAGALSTSNGLNFNSGCDVIFTGNYAVEGGGAISFNSSSTGGTLNFNDGCKVKFESNYTSASGIGDAIRLIKSYSSTNNNYFHLGSSLTFKNHSKYPIYVDTTPYTNSTLYSHTTVNNVYMNQIPSFSGTTVCKVYGRAIVPAGNLAASSATVNYYRNGTLTNTLSVTGPKTVQEACFVP